MLLPFYRLYPKLLQNLIWVPTRLIFKFFTHLKIGGLVNLNQLSPGVIFAVNHASELDSIFLPASLPFLSRFSPMFYTSREREFYKTSGWRQFFYGGLFFKLWGAYPVVPGIKNRDLSLTSHIQIIKDGGSVCIFPEGKKTKDGKLRTPQTGVSYLSWKTGAPVVPVAINGLFKIGLAGFFSRRQRVIILFGRPLFPTDLFTREEVSRLRTEFYPDCKPAADRVMKQIADLLKLP